MSKSSRLKGYGTLDGGNAPRKLEITVISAAPISEVGFRDAVREVAKEDLSISNVGNGKAPLLPQSKSSGSLNSLLGRAAGGSGTSSRNSRAGSIEDLADIDTITNVAPRRGPTIIRAVTATTSRSNGDLAASALENPAFRMESNKNRAAPAPPLKAPSSLTAPIVGLDVTKKLAPSCPPPRPKEPPRVIAENKVDTPVSNNLINFDFETVPKVVDTPFKFSKSNDLMTGSPPPLSTKTALPLGRPYGVALFDYKSPVGQDLSFSVGDVILIERHLSDGWCFGYSQDGHSGNCPINYLDIRCPLPSSVNNISSTLTDFTVSSTGVPCNSSFNNQMNLTINNGDDIKLMPPEHDPKPKERISVLCNKPPPLNVKPQLPVKPPRTLSNIEYENIIDYKNILEPAAVVSTLPSHETQSSSFPVVHSADFIYNEASVTSGAYVTVSGPRCTALFDYVSVEPGDLSFKCGEIITLLSRHNEEWLEGKLRTEQGIFPASFVRIDEELPPLPISQINNETLLPAAESETIEIQSHERNPLYLVKALYAYGGIDGDLTFEVNDLISILEERGEWLFGCLQNNTDFSAMGIFPANFVKKVQGPFADVLFDFKAEFDNELSLLSGEIVLSVSTINNDWLSGELPDGRVGIFPQHFVRLRR